MKDRLLARLRNKKGFTLIELLVVIAIIAVLVVIVVVAINPVQRLNDASDRGAQANVRAAGTLLSTCVTQELVLSNLYEPCGADGAPLTTYGNPPNGTTLTSDPAVGESDVCAAEQGSSANYFVYKNSTGEALEVSGTMDTSSPYDWCVTL